MICLIVLVLLFTVVWYVLCGVAIAIMLVLPMWKNARYKTHEITEAAIQMILFWLPITLIVLTEKVFPRRF